MSREESWKKLMDAAYEAVNAGTTEAKTRLSESAKAWAACNGYSQVVGGALPVAKSGKRSGHVIPFGRSKGQPIEEVDAKDLTWVAGALRTSIDDETKSRWREANQALLAAIEAELETR